MGTKERLEILTEHYKNYFPEDTEAIVMTKEDYERLTELCDKYEEEHRTTFEEWKKTISIIDELEKYINYKIEQCYDEGSTVGEFNKICDIDEKLKELKGVDKE